MILRLITIITFASVLNENYFSLAIEITPLAIQSVPKFPIFPNTPFEIVISPSSNSKLVNYQNDTLIIRITNEDGSELEKFVFVYGKDSVVFQQYFGSFLHISSLKKNSYQQFISILLQFPLEANNKFIEIYQISSPSEETYLQSLKSLKLANLLYLTKIILVVPPKVELHIKSIKGKPNEFYPGTKVFVTCQSFGELPFWKPDFTNSNDFTVVYKNYIEETNKLHMKLMMTTKDHLKKIKCQTGNITKEIQIKIYHFPTSVNITPQSDAAITFNETIFCGPKNGYPIPKTLWKFVSGPINSNLFYKMSEDKMHLTFNRKPTEESEWFFNCTAINNAGSLEDAYHKVIKITIADNYIFVIDNEKLNEQAVYQRILFKKIFNRLNSPFKQYFKEADRENQKLKQTDIKLIQEINDLKKQLTQTTDEIKQTNEIDNIKSKITYQGNQIEEIKNNIVIKSNDLSRLKDNHDKLQNDVVKQNDDISVLKIQMNTINMRLDPSKVNFEKITEQIKNLTIAKLIILARLKYIKDNLYLIAPFSWIVHNIDFDEDEKREAGSHSFYSPMKGIKMNLHITVTKDLIQIVIHFPIFLRNNLHGWPFNCEITIIIVHPKFENVKISDSKSMKIQTHPAISDVFTFDKRLLRRKGYLADDEINIICDVKEL